MLGIGGGMNVLGIGGGINVLGIGGGAIKEMKINLNTQFWFNLEIYTKPVLP